jgi:nitrite reductase (NADH) small subunit
MKTAHSASPVAMIKRSSLVENAGVCALIDGVQVAIFYLPHEEQQVYALGNWDPAGAANVLSRGIVGDVQGELVVASPLYKHHFSLLTGRCQEDPKLQVPVYQARLEGEAAVISIQEYT